MATKLLQSASKVEDAYGRSRAIGFDAYDTFRENMEDLLSVLMQQVNPDTANKSAESRRINRDVKFKGKTRILQIESPVGNIVYKDANFNWQLILDSIQHSSTYNLGNQNGNENNQRTETTR